MFIRTERLFLRPGWIEDAPELAQAIGDESIVRNLASVPWPYRTDHAREWLTMPKPAKLPSFLITLPTEGGLIVGVCGFHAEEGEPAFGYWIARSHQGRGYATEAGRAILSLGKAIGHRRIRADHFADNPASGSVLRKVGFKATGRTSNRGSFGRGATALSIEYSADLDDNCAVRMPVAA